MNKVILIGNCGIDAEHKQEGETQRARVNIATTRKWTSEDGQHEETEWHQVVCFGQLAGVMKLLKKGEKVAIEGRIHTHTFTREGEEQPTHAKQVIAERIELFGMKPAATATKPAAAKTTTATKPAAKPAQQTAPPEDNGFRDDIPF